MIRFNNDYNRGAFSDIMQALSEDACQTHAGYGIDDWCDKASDTIRKLIHRKDADIWYFPGATQANYVLIARALTSVQSVVCADTGHINAHEAASIENTGHKILELPNKEGKIDADQVKKVAEAYYGEEAEYLTEPKLVYISFPTEQGTIYSKEELKNLSLVCREFGMYLFVDGARLPYGLGASNNDVTLEDLALYTDAFYLGGTKCGALFGEALVLLNKDLKPRFKAYMKQNGAVMAKGWLMGLMFHTMLSNGEYFEASKRADQYAMQIRAAFEEKKIPLMADSYTNQQFVILSDENADRLSEDFVFEDCGRDERGRIARFCTSWATSEEEVEKLISVIQEL